MQRLDIQSGKVISEYVISNFYGAPGYFSYLKANNDDDQITYLTIQGTYMKNLYKELMYKEQI